MVATNEVPDDLALVLASTGGMAPVRILGEVVNPTPCLNHLACRVLARTLKDLKPRTELELAYWSALYDFVQAGGQSESEQVYKDIRRLEFQVYLACGFSEERLRPFYTDIFS